MDMLLGRTGKREVVISYMNAPLPYAIEDSFGRCFFEDDDDDLAQVLQDQVGWCY
jgi:E3 ubiquitin-protein ligase BIG BROTHER and related proteins